jgi:tRNA-dihydrouridine synthase A
MVTTRAILHGDRERLLAHDPCEHPLAIQLGGGNPEELARCAYIAAAFGYDEINLNVGCPSNRVQSGRFGACLMAEPALVRACIAAMCDAVNLPITVKTRIGVDKYDSYDELVEFIGRVADGGCKVFILHARKAWLTGLNPKENRRIPPLSYDTVYRIKQDFPNLTLIVNGGINSLEQVTRHLHLLDGVMIGRTAHEHPYFLAKIDKCFFGAGLIPTRYEVIQELLPYTASQLQQGIPIHRITRHLIGLFKGVRGAKAWRCMLREHSYRPDAGIEVLENLLQWVEKLQI